jgi:hypothetical protein
MSYLTDNLGNKSSMRWNTRLAYIMGAVLLACAGASIIIYSLKGKEVSWAAVGAFAVLILAGLAGNGWVQKEQKQIETEGERVLK